MRVVKQSWRTRFFFLRNCLFFLLFLFHLFLFNDLINKVKKCFDVLLFILLADLVLHTVLLLGQLVFCTYALFGTLRHHYKCGLVVMALDSGSDVRGFDSHHQRYFCFCARWFFNYNVHDIFSILIFHN